jgi:hypothetical protein
MMDALAIADRETFSEVEERLAEHRSNRRRCETRRSRGEAITLASLPPGTLYCVVDNYEALKEAFADRVADLNVSLSEIDAATGMTRGNMQKCLSNSDAKWARGFGLKSLGNALKGTGLALALIVDDERFAPIKAQMVQRKLKSR